MKIINAFVSLMLIISLILLAGCKNLSSLSVGEAELKIGVDKIGSELNPFYAAENEEILNQIYVPVLQKTADNSLKNYCGGISYEYVGTNQIKYTITIRDNLRFSNGDYATIQDLIEFFYFISDATYKGTYSDWYLNDIAGLKEWNASCEGDYAIHTDANGQKALQDAYLSGTEVTIELYVDAENYYKGTAYISSLSIEDPVDDVVSFSCEFTGTGQLTFEV